MNILQIWISDALPEPTILDMMRNTSEKGDYTLVTSKTIYDALDQDMRHNIKRHIDIDVYEEDLKGYEKRLRDIWDNMPAYYKADFLRFYYLAHNPNTLYVDTDAEILRMPSLNRIAFSERNKVTRDICLLYNGTELQYFKDLIKKALDLCPTVPQTKMWFYRLVNIDCKIDAQIISRKYFTHLGEYKIALPRN